MSYIDKEKLIRADIASIENKVRHAFNQGYDLGFKEGKERAKTLETKPKTGYWILTKEDNDLPFPTKWYKCSECGKEICEPTPKFCDECGAKIIGIKDKAEK